MGKMKRLSVVFPLIVISLLAIGSCGTEVPSAPDGSTIEFIKATDGISICGGNIGELEKLIVSVQDRDGNFLNDVRVNFIVTFAGVNSPNSPFRIINNGACPETCERTPEEDWVMYDAEVFSPFETQTDDHGTAELLLYIPPIVELNVAVTARSGSNIEETGFDINADCPAVN